ncbi:MAG: hypoxanthine phosphoribosyltransferase [Gemmatimonadetes bacterium]|nr:hypoxanthine phosphoribosyltransferase [Pseudomonadales bacterium]NIW36729.1 hypoxanthine phosphoribosyltransferase [Gemmatimonadota bacterium]NIX07711.1 hypoxanthine phosphoribosyltransferase [Pseudomonadales bacterium]
MREVKVLYKSDAIARRVRELGRQITRDFRGQTLDVVGRLDSGFVFMADLVRAVDLPMRYHFVRAETLNLTDPSTGKERREIFYSPEVDARGKNVLLVDGVLQSGVTADFVLRRLGLYQPRALKTAVLLDKPADRRLSLEPDYAAFRLASNRVVVGYGLAWDGLHGNLPYLGTFNPDGGGARRPAARRKKAKGRPRARR